MPENNESFGDLFERYGTVDVLRVDGDFVNHQTDPATNYGKHLVGGHEVAEVHSDSGMFFPNIGANRRAPVIMVGYTREGRYICVPIVPTSVHGEWVPISAYEANSWARELYEKRRSG